MVEQQVKNTHREIKIIREVSNQAELFYDKAVTMGDHASIAFQRNHRSQMTNLETLAESALKATDIFDYIKRQTARYPFWRHKHKDVAFGESLRKYLEVDLRTVRDTICTNLHIGEQSEQDLQARRHVYLQLMRQFIRQMVIEYEFQTSLGTQNLRQGQQR